MLTLVKRRIDTAYLCVFRSVFYRDITAIALSLPAPHGKISFIARFKSERDPFIADMR